MLLTRHSTTALPTLRFALGDFVLPKADADEGAAAITDHHAIASATTVRGENDRIGGVAIRAEIAGVGNKDLVHDVVQRTHQQRK